MYPVFKTDYISRKFTSSIEILKMSPFKLLNFVVLVIMFLGHEVSAPQNEGQIQDFFTGSTVLGHARYAMNHYTSQTDFVGSARDYYRSFEEYFDENSIMSVEEFCAERYPDRKHQCESIVKVIFPADKMGALKYAFYETTFTLSGYADTFHDPIWKYFNSMVQSFTLYAAQTQCLRQIENSFTGSTVHEHAKYAMANYTRLTNCVGSGSYYRSFEEYLNENSIMSPRDFCNQHREDVYQLCERKYCFTIKFAIQLIFPDINMMRRYIGTSRAPVWGYYTSILESFTLHENFPGPLKFCEERFPSPQIQESNRNNENSENQVNYESSSEEEQPDDTVFRLESAR